MKNITSKTAGFGAWIKEKVRKFLVAIKKNPQAFPLVALCLTFIHYSFNMTDVSDTTAKIQGPNMGLAQFVTMLFLILSFVCMLSAFPKRQKPKVIMIVIMIALYSGVIVANVHYINCIVRALTREVNAIDPTDYILNAKDTTVRNIIFVGITTLLILVEPIIAKLLKKIKTSIDVEGSGDIESIDITDED